MSWSFHKGQWLFAQEIDEIATKYTHTMTNLETARRYIQAIENGAVGPTLTAFFTDDVVQEEFPNKLNPHGAVRDLTGLLDAAVRGQAVLSSQTLTILHEMEDGNTIAFELQWTGTLAISIGTLSIGDVMRARFATFLEFRDGKIAHQRNYDCFEA